MSFALFLLSALSCSFEFVVGGGWVVVVVPSDYLVSTLISIIITNLIWL